MKILRLRFIRFLLLGGVLVTLLGCYDSNARSQQNQPILKIAVKTSHATATSNSNLMPGPQYRILSKTLTKPNCSGDACPSITFNRLDFEAHPRFNAFLVRSQLEIALMDVGQDKTFTNLGDLANAFWKTADERYEIVLSAEVIRDTSSMVVAELYSYAYTGGAHGMSTAMYVNWSPSLDKIFTLNDVVLKGRMKAFEEVLKKKHAQWLKDNEFAQADMAAYLETWPFYFSDNVALLQDGIAVTYGHYVLGPYALGMPTIVVPYSELKGVINSGLLKRLRIRG
jgi:hypothetical protein